MSSFPRILFVTSIVFVLIGNCLTVRREKRNNEANQLNIFLGVTARCTNGYFTVDVNTEEPFHGSIYARGYPSVCGAVGGGTNMTSLTVNVQECGVKIHEDENGEHSYEFVVYVQFDKWVQQVIDEQVHVKCKLKQEVNKITTSKIPEIKSFSAKPNLKIRANSRTNEITTNNLATKLRSLISLSTTKDDWEPVTTPSELINYKKSLIKTATAEPISCWMDIVKGVNIQSRPVVEHLLVGEMTTIVIKVHQRKGLDTHVTSCLAHDGSGEQTQHLIDKQGCAVDETILPQLRIQTNAKSGLKISSASFKAFKFPDTDNLHIRCMVLVCKESCGVPSCGVRKLEIKKRIKEAEEDPKTSHKRLKEELRGTLNVNRIVDQIEVFNAVEIKAPNIDHEPNFVKSYRNLEQKSADSVDFLGDENVFCVTPYKMILAFGVLLAILLTALLFALYTCVKERVTRQRMKPQMETLRHNHIGSAYFRFAH